MLNGPLPPAPFVTKPFDEKGIDFLTQITLSDPAVGLGRTATASEAAFLAADAAVELGWWRHRSYYGNHQPDSGHR